MYIYVYIFLGENKFGLDFLIEELIYLLIFYNIMYKFILIWVEGCVYVGVCVDVGSVLFWKVEWFMSCILIYIYMSWWILGF